MRHFLCLLVLFCSVSAFAITPEEQLSDPLLESRARALSLQMRCLVCQNQSIDDSDAELARDLRLEVRRLLLDGLTDAEVLSHIHQRYGDYVLLNPPVSSNTALLWASPIMILLIGGSILWLQYRRREQPIEKGIAAKTLIKQGEEPTTTKPIPLKIYLGTGGGILALCLGLYLIQGRPDLPAQPFDLRIAEIDKMQSDLAEKQASDQDKLAVALKAVQDQPDDAELWLNLLHRARIAVDYATERQAIDRLRQLSPNNTDFMALDAEALIRAADNQVTVPARKILQQTLQLDPQNPLAVYLTALASYQDGALVQAIQQWRSLLSDNRLTPDRIDTIRQNIALANAALEQQGETIPNMTDSIKDMVAGLAQDLQENPDNLEGWRMIAQSYLVLEQLEGHIDALFQIARLQPQDFHSQRRPLEILLAQNIAKDYIPESTIVLDRMAKINADRLEYLFLAGHMAKLSGYQDKARQYWQRLYDKLPEDAPILALLRQEMADLDS